MIYHSYFHCVMKYGIKLWGNSIYSKNTFRLGYNGCSNQSDLYRIFQNIKYLIVNPYPANMENMVSS